MEMRRGVWRIARVVIGALLLAWAFRACVAEPFRIPSESMATTLLPGDYVLVSKLSYGGLFEWADPQQGDVIAFRYPLESDDPPVYVKRIAGLPGDTVALFAKELRVNNQPTPLPTAGRIRWRVTSLPGDELPLDAPALRRLNPVVLADTLALVHATTDEIASIRDLAPHPEAAPDLVLRGASGPATFPNAYGFSRDFYGPLRVPAKGDTVRLTRRTWPLYQTLIQRHERRAILRTPSGFVESDQTHRPCRSHRRLLLRPRRQPRRFAGQPRLGLRPAQSRRRSSVADLLLVGEEWRPVEENRKGCALRGYVRRKYSGRPFASRSFPAV